jgi:hypothetical protein
MMEMGDRRILRVRLQVPGKVAVADRRSVPDGSCKTESAGLAYKYAKGRVMVNQI